MTRALLKPRSPSPSAPSRVIAESVEALELPTNSPAGFSIRSVSCQESTGKPKFSVTGPRMPAYSWKRMIRLSESSAFFIQSMATWSVSALQKAGRTSASTAPSTVQSGLFSLQASFCTPGTVAIFAVVH